MDFRLLKNAWEILEEIQSKYPGPYVIMGYTKEFDLDRFDAEKITSIQAFPHKQPPTFSHHNLRCVYQEFRQKYQEGHWKIVVLNKKREIVVLDTELMDRIPLTEAAC
ncbi:MAG: hypothetical protein HY707_08945 [Ignavibacteriae bacterium]|nr:hypothetical protein [Ignavibacteriota bacterium]